MEKKTLITAEAEMQILVTEPERQYYFIEKAKENLAKLMEQEKRSFTFCVTTFGCQMNARVRKNWSAYWNRSGMSKNRMRKRQILSFIIRVLFGRTQIREFTDV